MNNGCSRWRIFRVVPVFRAFHSELINLSIGKRFNVEMRELRAFHTYFVRIKREARTESTSIGFLPLMQYSCRDVKIAFGPSPGRLCYTSHVPKTFLCITATISKASDYSSVYLGGFFPERVFLTRFNTV